MHLKVNLSPRQQKLRTGNAVTAETLHLIKKVPLTRRIMLSQVHAIYDPLGLLSLIMIKYKLVLLRIIEASLGKW